MSRLLGTATAGSLNLTVGLDTDQRSGRATDLSKEYLVTVALPEL